VKGNKRIEKRVLDEKQVPIRKAEQRKEAKKGVI
jgi:hypothetical protein